MKKIVILFVVMMLTSIAPQYAYAQACITMIIEGNVVDENGNDAKQDWMKRPNENCKNDHSAQASKNTAKTVNDSSDSKNKTVIKNPESSATQTNVTKTYNH